MALTEIEEFLFKGENSVHSVTDFRFDGKEVRVQLRHCSNGLSKAKIATIAVFASAVMESVENDPTDTESAALDINGFDCCSEGDQWRFVLNCGSVEWCWRSFWPTIRNETIPPSS